MTKEQFKIYICSQIDLMEESELQEFSQFLDKGSSSEEIVEEIISIKGEFKKLTKLVHSMESKIDNSKLEREKEELSIFIEFDSFLKNSKDAIDSLPKASLFNQKKVNGSIRSLQIGFGAISEQYKKILDQVGLKRSANIGDKFNSDFHEAVDVVDNRDMEDGVVIEVLEEGFLYNSKIINYAKVKVNQWTL